MNLRGTPPNQHYPNWSALLDSPSDQYEAVSAFLVMARADSKDPLDKKPSVRARNYSAPTAHPYRVRFDLRDPDPIAGTEGDQDHFLFKTTGDTHGRTHKGQRRTEDFDAERAKRIAFIPETLLNPDFVFRVRREPWKVVYVARTGSDEFFIVLLEELTGSPRFNFSTAYPVTAGEFTRKRDEWQRLFPGSQRKPRTKN